MSTYKYSHPNESIEPYLKLLYRNYLTDEAEAGLLKKFVDRNGNRFASDKNYEEKLSYKYKYIGSCSPKPYSIFLRLILVLPVL